MDLRQIAHAPCRLLLDTLIRGVLLGASVVVACVWADALLYVSQGATEVVLAKEDLQALVNEPPPQHLSSPEPERDDPVPLAGREGRHAADAFEPVDEAPHAAAVASEEIEPAESGDRKSVASGQVQTDQPSVDTSDVDANAPVEHLTPLGGQGTLASFAGESPHGSPDQEASPRAGRGAGTVWDVQFRGQPTIGMLRSIDGAQLAAVRQRRGFIEAALVRENGISPPTDLDDLLRGHPEYSGRNGIVLDRRWLDEVEDRLLTYGGGWQAWLLIEDGLFSAWRAAVDRRIKALGLNWESVERIEAAVQVRRVDKKIRANFLVLRLHQKQPPAEPVAAASLTAEPASVGQPSDVPE